ncbi:MAG: RHS repeat protein, partial [Desulfobulbaceae bacterium]|nr:RHS repeat protein [Desulfobulbaceae bacterium]
YTAATQYDLLGRQLSVTDPENNSTTYEYDGRGQQTAMIDAASVRTTYLYDDLGRMVGVIENDVPGNNPTQEADVLTQYVFDALGNQVSITNALGISTTYTVYDDLNRPVRSGSRRPFLVSRPLSGKGAHVAVSPSPQNRPYTF